MQPDLKKIQGMTAEDILMTFYDSMNFTRDKFGWSSKLDLNFYKGKVVNFNLLNASNGKIVVPSVGWVTTIAPAMQFGLEPIMVGADSRTFGIDLDKLEEVCE